MRYLKIFLLSLIIIIILPFNVTASNFIVYDVKGNKDIDFFSTYEEAKSFYDDNIDSYDNLAIKKDEEYYNVEYGIAYLKSNEVCDYEIEYHINDQTNYMNACFGADAVFIDGDQYKGKVYIASQVIEISKDDYTLIPYEELNVRISSYKKINNVVYHQVKNQLDNDFYAFMINLGVDIQFLTNNQEYFSYDGNYFYSDFYKMVDDLKNKDHSNALNKNDPYFNYYQYLPYRTFTNYDPLSVEGYFKNDLKFDGKINRFIDEDGDGINDIVNKSQLYDEIISFFEYQYLYGANALMMLSLAIYESDYGRSIDSYHKNSVFKEKAYDNELENSNDRYLNIQNSIYSHAKYYMSSLFSDIKNSDYSGTFFGNKAMGLNKAYSKDIYWGEKIASIYAKIDQKLGSLDYNNYNLAIILDEEDLNIYANTNKDEILYTLKGKNNTSMIVLKELKNSYKVQLDNSFLLSKNYDFISNIGYIDKSVVDYYINNGYVEKEYHKVTYNAQDGSYKDGNVISFNIPKDLINQVSEPIKKGYDFIHYFKENNSYIAQYKKIKKVELLDVENEYILNENYLDFKNLKLMITYDDGESTIKNVDTNMISNYNREKQEIEINYNGFSNIIKVKELMVDATDFKNILSDYFNSKNENNLKNIVESLIENKYSLNILEIRELDKEASSINKNAILTINKNNYNLSVSGLYLSTLNNRDNNFIFNDVFNVFIEKYKIDKKQLEFLTSNGYEVVDGFNFKIIRNYDEFNPMNQLVVSLKINENDINGIYTMFYIDGDDLIKLKTTRSKSSISFITRNTGRFILVRRNSSNNYDFEDVYENLNKETKEINYMILFINTMIVSLVLVMISLAYIFRKKVKYGKITKNNRS